MNFKLPQQRLSTICLQAMLAMLCTLISSGCTLSSKVAQDAIAVNRLPPEWRAASKEALQPINLALLANPGEREHRLGPGDVVGVHIEGILSELKAAPFVYYPDNLSQNLDVPALGVPFRLDEQGNLQLPRLKRPLPLAGLTITEANRAVIAAFTQDAEILKPDQSLIRLELIQPYSPRVVVIRGDRRGDFPTIVSRTNQVISQHGSGQELLLRRPENDVLHALAETGGLPGSDAEDAVWILRSLHQQGQRIAELSAQVPNILNTTQKQPYLQQQCRVIRIPLRIYPGQPLPFRAEDVTLHDGDVVYVPPRRPSHFIVGGLVDGGRYVLPRDEDINVIEAIALANGPTAGTGPQTLNLRGGPGNIVDPSRVIVIRTLPTGDKIKIFVDLAEAHVDPTQELLIQADDVVVLQYKEHELAANVALNFFTFSFNFSKSVN